MPQQITYPDHLEITDAMRRHFREAAPLNILPWVALHGSFHERPLDIGAFVRAQTRPLPVETQRLDGRRLVVWRSSFRQRSHQDLDAVWLALNTSPSAFDVTFEIRMDNKLGVNSGNLTFQTSIMSEDQCIRMLRNELTESESIP